MTALGKRVSPGHETVRQRGQSIQSLINKFVAYLATEPCLATSTIKRYKRSVVRLKSWARWKRKAVLDLTSKDCERWKLSLIREGLSFGTVNILLIAAKRFFRYLQLDGYVIHNPFDLVAQLLAVRGKTLPISTEEVDRLLAVPDVTTYYGLLDRAILELLYAAGLRPAELVSLELRSVDLGSRRLICVGKGSKQRIVPFGRSAGAWLERYLSRRSEIRGKDQTKYFFVKETGERLSTTYVRRHVRKHGLDVGLPDLVPRTLRHTFAGHLFENGASIVHVQQLIGHGSYESTEIYTYVTLQRLKKTYSRHHPRANLVARKHEEQASELHPVGKVTA